MKLETLKLDLSPSEFFRERLSHAQSRINTKIQPEISEYLTTLLVNFIHPPKLATSDHEQELLDQTLFDILKLSMEANQDQRYELLKQLADTSLYVSGFFQDYFNRKIFDIDYYITMGRSAYYHIATMQHTKENRIFINLCNQFTVCVDLVAYVSEHPENMKNSDILAVYNRWSKSNSQRLFKILQEAGITPIPSTLKVCS